MAKYIPTEVLMAEIERMLHFDNNWIEGDKRRQMHTNGVSSAYYKMIGSKHACESILDFVNSLEVKEVDLKELNDWQQDHFHGRRDADGVYPEEGGVHIWKNGHTFLVTKDWNKGEWPLLNGNGYERSKKNKERLMTEVESLLDWDFVSATKHIQELGTDIPLKEGEYMITAPVHLAMYEYRHELNKALRAMGAEEINFDENCWFAQRSSAFSAWIFIAESGTLSDHYHPVNYAVHVRAVSL